jgi:hypothetical protein
MSTTFGLGREPLNRIDPLMDPAVEGSTLKYVGAGAAAV